jgi:hypothetical protein
MKIHKAGFGSSVDTQCFIECVCWHNNKEMSISDTWITRCPQCGRGYRTEFRIIEYEKHEFDHQYRDEVAE